MSFLVFFFYVLSEWIGFFLGGLADLILMVVGNVMGRLIVGVDFEGVFFWVSDGVWGLVTG